MTAAARTGGALPGGVVAQGTTRARGADGGEAIPWHLGWHFIAHYPEYRERVVVHHDEGSIELEFATPYLLNAPTVLRVRSAGPDLGSAVARTTWPQEEAFERELYELVALARGRDAAGPGPAAARADLVTAQRLWRACAAGAGMAPDPDSEAGRG